MKEEKRLHKDALKLYAITDRSWLGGRTLYEQVEKALKGGITMLQLREKNTEAFADEDAFMREMQAIKELCHAYRIPFIVNDYVELAARLDADGVHIGQADMEIRKARQILGENKIIGVTAKTTEQAKRAQAAGADYLGSGAVFGSSTKKNAKPMEHDLLQKICESVSIPVVAIGGIDAGNAAQLAGRKIAGIAVVSGIFAQENIEAAAGQLREIAEHII
ncbi:MAG: thiamine phosphate synthase [Lachnospiraceae bacterium]|nr:thiamine phosphate synthase [Lachnospiraceae bacterium]